MYMGLKFSGFTCLGFTKLLESIIIFTSFNNCGLLPVIISLNSFSENCTLSFWDSNYTNVRPSDIVRGSADFFSPNHFFSFLSKLVIFYWLIFKFTDSFLFLYHSTIESIEWVILFFIPKFTIWFFLISSISCLRLSIFPFLLTMFALSCWSIFIITLITSIICFNTPLSDNFEIYVISVLIFVGYLYT